MSHPFEPGSFDGPHDDNSLDTPTKKRRVQREAWLESVVGAQQEPATPGDAPPGKVEVQTLTSSEDDDPPISAGQKRTSTGKASHGHTKSSAAASVPTVSAFGAIIDSMTANTQHDEFEPAQLDTLASEDVYTDLNLSQVKKLEKIFKGLERTQRSVVSVDEILGFHIKDYLQAGKQLKRHYRARKHTKGSAKKEIFGRQMAKGDPKLIQRKDSWTLEFADSSGHRITFQAISEMTTGLDIFDKKEMGRFINCVERVINTWPYGAPAGRFSRELILAVAAYHTTGRSMACDVPHWTGGKDGFRMNVYFIDEKTGTHDKIKVHIRRGLTVTGDPPALPDHVILCNLESQRHVRPLAKINIDGKMVYESVLPQDYEPSNDPVYLNAVTEVIVPTRAELHTRENCMRFQKVMLEGCISNSDEMWRKLEALELYYSQALTARSRIGGKVDTRSLLMLRTNPSLPGRVMFVTGMSNTKILGMPNPDQVLFIVHTTNIKWITIILEAAKATFQLTLDLKTALLEAARTADDVIELIKLGHEPPELCACTDQTRASTTHICDNCKRDTLCSNLVSDQYGYRLCPICHDQTFVIESDVVKQVRYSVTRVTNYEVRARGLSKSDAQISALIEDTCTSACEQLQGCKPMYYRNYFTGEETRQPAAYSGFRLCVDAVLPLDMIDKFIFAHTPGNVAVISIWLNLAKGRYPVGVLELCAGWAKSDKSPEQTQQFLDRMMEMHIVNIDWPMKRAFQPTSLSSQQFARIKHEWLTGVRINKSKLSKRQLGFNAIFSRSYTARDRWTHTEKKALKQICLEISEHCNTRDRLSYGKDGSPWFDQLGPRPSWWSWKYLSTFCYDRFLRMKTACNRHWLTVDTPLTIACEIFFQLNTDLAEYKSLLELPIVLYQTHPLCLSIGHKNHGLQMRTGWSENPQSLADRDNAKNNIKIMTAIENKAEWNWKPEDYPAIIASWLKVNIPSRFFVKDGRDRSFTGSLVDSGLSDDRDDVEENGRIRAQKIDEKELESVVAQINAAQEEQYMSIVSQGLPTAAIAITTAQQGMSTAIASQGLPTAATTINTVEGATPVALSSQGSQTVPAFPWSEAQQRIAQQYDQTLLAAHGFSTSKEEGYTKEPVIAGASYPSLAAVEALNPQSNPRKVAGIQPGTEHWAADDLLRYRLKMLERPDLSSVAVSLEIASQALYTHNPEGNYYDSARLRDVISSNEALKRQGKGHEGNFPQAPAPTCEVLHRIFNLGGGHWIHLEFCVDPRRPRSGQIRVRDSLAEFATGYEDVLALGRLYSQNEKSHWHGIIWDIVNTECPQQADSSNCGFHAVESIRVAMTDGEMPMSPQIDDEKLIFGLHIREKWMAELYKDLFGVDIQPEAPLSISASVAPMKETQQPMKAMQQPSKVVSNQPTRDSPKARRVASIGASRRGSPASITSYFSKAPLPPTPKPTSPVGVSPRPMHDITPSGLRYQSAEPPMRLASDVGSAASQDNAMHTEKVRILASFIADYSKLYYETLDVEGREEENRKVDEMLELLKPALAILRQLSKGT